MSGPVHAALNSLPRRLRRHADLLGFCDFSRRSARPPTWVCTRLSSSRPCLHSRQLSAASERVRSTRGR
jgi:hypothetical protein